MQDAKQLILEDIVSKAQEFVNIQSQLTNDSDVVHKSKVDFMIDNELRKIVDGRIGIKDFYGKSDLTIILELIALFKSKEYINNYLKLKNPSKIEASDIIVVNDKYFIKYNECFNFVVMFFAVRDFIKDVLTIDGDFYFKGLDMVKIAIAWEKANIDLKNKAIDQKTYIMIDLNTGMYKIGKSKKPKFREKTLSSEMPNIKLLFICDADIEKILHDEYVGHQVRGEWFNLTEKQIQEIISDHGFYAHEVGFSDN